ncbi:MAG: protein kinase [Vulcanimicrobiota bacterium]
MNRVPAPGAFRGLDGRPLTILPDGTMLKGTYRTEFLAVGGMSVVYRVHSGDQIWLAKEVPAQESRALLALGQEKSLLERLDHPSIVKSHEMFEEDGFYYLIREYVEGLSLEQRLPAQGFLEEKLVLELALRLCNVLGYLHAQNPPVIYRDLKPKNVIQDADGKLMLFDFGIARSFKEGKAQDTVNLGSALTASPEHYGGQTDARSDLFTLGATLHYLLTGGQAERENPFVFPSVREVNPQVSEPFANVIAGCLRRKPEERYQSASELAQALLECNSPPGSPNLPALAHRPDRWRLALPLVLLILAGLGWASVAHRDQAPSPVATRSVTAQSPAARLAPTVHPIQLTPLSASPPSVPVVADPPRPRPTPTPPVSPSPVAVRPQLEPSPVYPHSRPAEPVELPPLLVDANLTRRPTSPLQGRPDPLGTWVAQAGLRYRIPPGYEQIEPGLYLAGQGRRLRLLAVRPLAGSRQPEEYAAARRAELGETAQVETVTVAGRPASQLTFRQPMKYVVLVGREVYARGPGGERWCISASSARLEWPELDRDLESLLESCSF